MSKLHDQIAQELAYLRSEGATIGQIAYILDLEQKMVAKYCRENLPEVQFSTSPVKLLAQYLEMHEAFIELRQDTERLMIPTLEDRVQELERIVADIRGDLIHLTEMTR